ncbi:MAG: universal stress protein [Bacteroidales bacterium]|nr:universal stress protein [Bacteroidales bacterium]MBN2821316.1 universal stress protein [Bacteroidales bacterium]
MKSIKHRVEILKGEPYREILSFIKSNKVDLLLMGTTGKTLLI